MDAEWNSGHANSNTVAHIITSKTWQNCRRLSWWERKWSRDRSIELLQFSRLRYGIETGAGCEAWERNITKRRQHNSFISRAIVIFSCKFRSSSIFRAPLLITWKFNVLLYNSIGGLTTVRITSKQIPESSPEVTTKVKQDPRIHCTVGIGQVECDGAEHGRWCIGEEIQNHMDVKRQVAQRKCDNNAYGHFSNILVPLSSSTALWVSLGAVVPGDFHSFQFDQDGSVQTRNDKQRKGHQEVKQYNTIYDLGRVGVKQQSPFSNAVNPVACGLQTIEKPVRWKKHGGHYPCRDEQSCLASWGEGHRFQRIHDSDEPLDRDKAKLWIDTPREMSPVNGTNLQSNSPTGPPIRNRPGPSRTCTNANGNMKIGNSRSDAAMLTIKTLTLVRVEGFLLKTMRTRRLPTSATPLARDRPSSAHHHAYVRVVRLHAKRRTGVVFHVSPTSPLGVAQL